MAAGTASGRAGQGARSARAANTASLALCISRQSVSVTFRLRVMCCPGECGGAPVDRGIATSPSSWTGAPLNDCAMVTVPCLITVAAGVLGPGHLGELTRYLPLELADDVLEGT